MAHVAKYSKGSSGVSHLLAHYERRQNDLGEYVKFGNQEIDLERTPQNYNCSENNMSAEDVLKRCQAHSKRAIRDNMNIMCDWVVTQPKSLPFEQSREFFEQTYQFLEDKYGKENVVSSWVHLDETTPHMHFAFTPITEDGRLSAKEVLNRQDLCNFHAELKNHLEKQLNHEIEILNGATVNGNKSILEMKQEQLEKEIQKQKEQIEKLKEVKEVKAKPKALIQPNKGLFGKETVDYSEYEKTVKAYNKLLQDSAVEKTAINALKCDLDVLRDDYLAVTSTDLYKANLELRWQNRAFTEELEQSKKELSEKIAESEILKKRFKNREVDFIVCNSALERSCEDTIQQFTDRKQGWSHWFKNILQIEKETNNKLDVFAETFNFKKPFGKEALKALNSLKSTLALPLDAIQRITKLFNKIFKSQELSR